ncbi:MAG TPA: ParB/RepB/Spo0J family partition protein [Chloroflexi bacterium]|nr:ParB/RepB/Spo0J family partition protein [Chloroflexota bacterium]
MAQRERRGLGRGLEALIPSADPVPGLRKVHIDSIAPNPRQPRTVFDPQALEDLAKSIREVGLIQPLIVHQARGTGEPGQLPRYQIIAGERRWRAARIAGLQHVDVIVKDVTPQEMLELALIENIQRADLSPIEEALAYTQLADEFGLTQEQIAERVGRSRVSVTNTIRLLRLPEEIQSALQESQITEGHARALLMLDEEDEQMLAFRTVVRKRLSVRQTEELVRRLQAATRNTERQRSRSPETEALEQEFRNALGTKVDLFRSRKGGRLVIHFYSEEELDALYNRLLPDQ